MDKSQHIDFPSLSENENVGIVSNYVTEEILSKKLNLFQLPISNFEKIISAKNIKSVFIEDYVYENDSEWFGKNYNILLSELNKLQVDIVIVSAIDRTLPVELSHYPSVIIDYNSTMPIVKDNRVFMPIILDELNINPANNTDEIDITYFKPNKLTHSDEIIQYHDKFKPKIVEASPNSVSREMIKRLVQTVKRSKMFYIHDDCSIDITLIKYLEVVSNLQNTLSYIESPKIIRNSKSVMVEDYQITADLIRTLVSNKMYLNKIVLKKTRELFINNTYIFTGSLLDVFKDQSSAPNCKADISVIVTTKRKESLSGLIQNLNSQYNVNLEVILLTHGYKLNVSEEDALLEMADFDLKILSESKNVSFGQCLNECVDEITHDYVIKMDDDDYYFPYFLIDLYIGIRYTGASIVGKNAFFFYLEEDNMVGQRRMDFQFKNVKEVKGNTILCKSETIREYGFSDIPRHVDSDLIIRIREDGGEIYSIHPYDMCVYRARDKSGHTYQVNDSRFIKDAHILYYGQPNQTISTE